MPRDRNRADWFGPRLRELREAAGLTQQQLGERAGVVGSQVNKLELGVNQPTLGTAVALAWALGLEIGAFVPADISAPEPAGPEPRGRDRPRKAASVPEEPAAGKGPARGPRRVTAGPEDGGPAAGSGGGESPGARGKRKKGRI